MADTPKWIWWAIGIGLVVLCLMLIAWQPGPMVASPTARAFWVWAEENANDPDAIELVSIEGPRNTPEGPLYQFKIREPMLGQKVLRERFLIIDGDGAREPRSEDVRAQLKYFGFEGVEEK